jgi:serine/threonine protein phosphatase PrpC
MWAGRRLKLGLVWGASAAVLVGAAWWGTADRRTPAVPAPTLDSAMPVRRVIHRRDPFDASRKADASARRAAQKDDEGRTAYFSEREVQNHDGSFPFGEGFLYDDEPRARAASFERGHGQPGAISEAGHRGTKPVQQDATGSRTFVVHGQKVATLAVADGVSGSGRLARPAAQTAVATFLEVLERELKGLPSSLQQQRPFVEQAMTRAAFAANFEMFRQVYLDVGGDKGFDASDAKRLEEQGVKLPTGRLSVAQMQRLAPRLDDLVAEHPMDRRSALATFATAIVVGSDLYTFSSGDAVVGLFRPGEKKGQRFIHLTHRDQAVVDLFQASQDDSDAWKAASDVYENVVTDTMGDQGTLTGTVRRYPALLMPGDRVLAASDGLGPRGGGEGLSREDVERILDDGGDAAALTEGQRQGIDGDDYQDNIGIVVLEVE